MRDKSIPDTDPSEGKARELVNYAREQAEPALQAQQAGGSCELPDDLFPGYTIIGNVSRGGQGRVYEAIDTSTQRRVAIKVMRSGPFGSDGECSRFEREIRVLAQLQHPNIVTIHSSGTVALQRYFVMDFIEGQPLDEYIRGNHLTIEQTLDLFLRICEAVNAAHLRGIVHRDIKPGNIRIDDHGDPHVLDFGLAKTTPSDAAEVSGSLDATVAGQFVGSLPWAAPEQVMNTPEAVDLRTDVYGLGLLLYFMLTQSFPYERSANFRDMADRIVEDAPVSPRVLRPEIDDELSTIVLKCLHKELDRRYQIAGELARDIKRYRAGEPIEAKHDSTGYLLAKMIRRHRGLALLALAFVLVSLGYAATMSLLYRRATESERLAEDRAAEVSGQYAVTRDAIGFLVNEVSDKLGRTPGNSRVRREILEGAFDRLLPLAQKHSDDPLLRDDLMRAHYQLGDLAIALGRDEVARAHLETALKLRLQSPPDLLAMPDAQSELSIHYVLLGDVAQHLGDLQACERSYLQALAIDEQLVADHPGNAHFQDNLAWSYDRLGLLADGKGELRRAEVLFKKQLLIMQGLVDADPNDATRLHGLAEAHNRLGVCAQQRWDWLSAAEHLGRAVNIGWRMVEADSQDSLHMYAHVVRVCVYDHAYRMAHPDEEPHTRVLEAMELAKKLVQLEPEVPLNREALALANVRLMMGVADGRDPVALETYARDLLSATDGYIAIAGRTPQIVWWRSSGHLYLANARRAQGDARGADEAFRQAVGSVKEALAAGIDDPVLRIHLAELLQDDPAATREERIAAINAARDSVLSSAGTKPAHIASVGHLYHAAGEFESAINMLLRAQAMYEHLGVDLPAEDARALSECQPLVGD